MNNINSNKWLYFLAGAVTGALLCWSAMTFIEPLARVRKLQKTISQDLATGNFANLQKHLDGLQGNLPIDGLSEERINKMIRDLKINKQGRTSTEK